MAQMTEVVAQIADLLRNSRHAVAFTGAGISTPSGIPDFRSTASGLWTTTSVNPMDVASINGFRQNPKAFYDWIYPLLSVIQHAEPNPAHDALAQFESMGLLHAVITQNIDNLHKVAGSQQVLELHGHIRQATCTHCFQAFDAAPIIQKLLEDRTVPRCQDCRGVIKPDVVLYGEQLPFQVVQDARHQAENADLMIIIGSSLEVAPASDMPLLTLKKGHGKLVIINLSPTHLDHRAQVHVACDAAQLLPDILRRVEQSI